MPEQPNYCTGYGKLMPDTNAAYYCSRKCMIKVLGLKEVKRLERVLGYREGGKNP